MGRIKSWLGTMPLRRAFASLVLVMALLVVCVSSITIYACMTVQERILSSVTYIEGKNIEPEPEEDTYTIVITDEGKVTPGENGMLVMLSKEYRLQNLTWQKRIILWGKGGDHRASCLNVCIRNDYLREVLLFCKD